ncbi:MAG: DNA primase [Bacilli bacterium]|nr:DNA primase [Bacilli bacterium]
MAVPQDLIERIVNEADISAVISSYIPVIAKGRNHVAVCPFHDDTRPSMQISRDKRIFKCFACGEGGNVISFVSKYEKISFDKAAKKVGDMIGIVDERLNKVAAREEKTVDPTLKPYYDCINDLQKFYQYGLTIEEGDVAKEYLNSRNLGPETISKYGIGYALADGRKTIQYLQSKGHSLHTIQGIGITTARNAANVSDSNAGRVIFPLRNPDGQVVGFSARRMKNDDTAKYINSPETVIFHKGSTLYNYSEAKKTAHRDEYVYLLEGFMDVMALNSVGINSAVALMGTALTQDHIALLRKLGTKEIRVCLDGDNAGQEGMMKITSLLNKAGLAHRIVAYGDDLRDPDEILQESGAEALKERMNNLIPFFDFQLNYYLNIKKLNTIEDKRKVLNYFLTYLSSMKNGEEKDNYIHKLAKATDFTVNYIRERLSKAKQDEDEIEETTYVKDIQIAKRRPESLIKRRINKAEREMLYYMLHSVKAVEYFEKKIDSFYVPSYNEIANYIIEAVERTKDVVDIPALVGNILASGVDNADALAKQVLDISDDTNHPPLVEGEDDLFDGCAIAIQQEKQKIHDQKVASESLNGKSVEEQAAVVAQIALRKRKAKGDKK